MDNIRQSISDLQTAVERLKDRIEKMEQYLKAKAQIEDDFRRRLQDDLSQEDLDMRLTNRRIADI